MGGQKRTLPLYEQKDYMIYNESNDQWFEKVEELQNQIKALQIQKQDIFEKKFNIKKLTEEKKNFTTS